MADVLSEGKVKTRKPFKGIPRQQFIGSILLILVGGALLVFQLIAGPQQAQRTASFTAVEGRVVAYSESRSAGQGNSIEAINYSEVVEYRVNNQTYRIVSSASSTHPKAIGSIFAVKYNPQNPQDAVLPGVMKQSGLVFLLIGGGFLLVGLFLLISPFLGLQLKRY
jgi:hypothetical protein